ncbi:flavin reductase family protein [Streptomyces sp. NPDC014894]|uniref:flavin reductase family protein n=1 Tax=Streptomyces sp. NPDC014894 TaxID=3364931 RepID=UPI00370078AB
MGHAAMAATAVRHLRSAGSAPAGARYGTPPGAAPRTAPRAVLRPVGEGGEGGEGREGGEAGRPPVVAAELRRVLGHFPTGVAVVTARDGDGPAGFACQSFSSLSLDPPLAVFMVGRASATWPRIARAGSFCANVLGEEQEALCRRFAVSGADKFAGVAHGPAPVTGSPLLAGAPAWADCEIQAVHTGGDHLIVVGRIVALGAEGGGEPLVFHRGRFRRLER